MSISTVNAPGLVEEYIESGSYKYLKELSAEKEGLNQSIYDHLKDYDGKRVEIGCNLVAKFIPKKVFQYDYSGLNEYLHDHGLLQKLTKLSERDLKKNQELLDLFDPYRFQPEYYLKFSFNQLGMDMAAIDQPPYQLVSLQEAAKCKRENMTCLKVARAEYQFLKNRIEKRMVLLEERKISHKYGTISRIQKPLRYDTDKIREHQAVMALMEWGKPKMDQLSFYIIKGFISKSAVESFRKLKDIKLEMVILDLDEEAALMSRLQQKFIRSLE